MAVEKEVEEKTKDSEGNDDKDKPKSDDDFITIDNLRYLEKSKFIWILLGAIQEQQRQINSLNERLSKLGV